MKKIISFIFLMGLILSLCSCGNKEITMQEIYDASHLNAMLENHESIYVQYMSDGKIYEEDYLSQDYTYMLYTGEYDGVTYDLAYFTTDDAFYSYTDGNYKRILLLSPDGLADMASYREKNDEVIILSPDTTMETIQSVMKKDNRITVTTFMDPANNEDMEAMGLISSNNEYVLDEKTHELISTKSVSDYGEGMVYDIASEILYDAEAPEGAKEFLKYDQQTEDLRSITIVSNPGTENEKSQSVQLPKGLSVSLESVLDTGETFTMYADEACTESFTSLEDYNSDTVIYVKWDE